MRFKQKLRVYSIAHQYEPAVGERIIRENPDLFYIVAGPPGITDSMRHLYRGMYKTLDERTYLNESWIRTNLWSGHGALARQYPGNVNLGGYRVNAVKEGDTPSFLHLLPYRLERSSAAGARRVGRPLLPNSRSHERAHLLE